MSGPRRSGQPPGPVQPSRQADTRSRVPCAYYTHKLTGQTLNARLACWLVVLRVTPSTERPQLESKHRDQQYPQTQNGRYKHKPGEDRACIQSPREPPPWKNGRQPDDKSDSYERGNHSRPRIRWRRNIRRAVSDGSADGARGSGERAFHVEHAVHIELLTQDDQHVSGNQQPHAKRSEYDLARADAPNDPSSHGSHHLARAHSAPAGSQPSGQEAAEHPGCFFVDLHSLGEEVGGGLVARLLGGTEHRPGGAHHRFLALHQATDHLVGVGLVVLL